jgi:hypothetical protein
VYDLNDHEALRIALGGVSDENIFEVLFVPAPVEETEEEIFEEESEESEEEPEETEEVERVKKKKKKKKVI